MTQKEAQTIAAPKIGAAYIRESTEEQDKGYSPDNQKESIENYARVNNIKITKQYKDLLSGTSAENRVGFQEMIDDAMKKQFDIILVFHSSRFARNVSEARKYKKLLREKLNIDVISINQNFGDWNDPSSFLNESINEVFDEYTSKQISFWVKTNLKAKRSKGKQLGNPPIGYYKKQIGFDREKERKIFEAKWSINKEEAELVKRIFEMYATRKYSIADIAKILTEEGKITKYNNPFTYDSVRGIIKNKVYLGLVHSPRKDWEDLPSIIHKAIITEDLFYKVHKVREERKKTCGRPPIKNRFYLLQGLIYCYGCYEKNIKNNGSTLGNLSPKMFCHTHPQSKIRKKEIRHYSCKLVKENKTCKETVLCKKIDQQVLKFMRGLILPEDIIKGILNKMESDLNISSEEKEEDERLKWLHSKKERFKTLFINAQEINESEYLNEVKNINKEIESIKISQHTNIFPILDKKEILKRTRYFLDDFGKLWDEELSSTEQREWILMTIKKIWVKNKKVIAIEPRNEYRDLFKNCKQAIAQVPLVTQKKRP